LEEYVKGKQIFLKFDPSFKPNNDEILAYVFLKNKIFVNKEMIKQGFAKIQEYDFLYKDNFMKVEKGS
jgi:endonuclease YncB( thermonuclease family)